jgi:hypothetical protein
MNRVEILLLERGERSRRLALNSPLSQGTGETVKYFANFDVWGASDSYPISSPVIKVLDEKNEDVTYGNHVATAVVNAGGAGYAVDDVLTITDAGSSGDATVTVTEVNAGAVVTVSITTAGYNYTAGTKATVKVAGGGDDNCTLDITVTDAELVVKASPTVVNSTEIEFILSNVLQYRRYTVYIKGTINSLIGEAMVVIFGEL